MQDDIESPPNQFGNKFMKSYVKKKTTLLDFKVGKSLWIFGPHNCIRSLIGRIVLWPRFDFIILFFILVSSMMLAIETPLDNPES